MKYFHSLSVDRVLQVLGSSIFGLERSEIEKRIKTYGRNILFQEKAVGSWDILWQQFKSLSIYILVFALAVSIILKDYPDSLVIFFAIVLNALIGYIQEKKANDSLKKLKDLVEHKALVLRNKREAQIDVRDIVVGDIVILRAGNKIPADGRLIEANNLSIDESPLTGESFPAMKATGQLPEGATLPDRINMAYAGTTVVKGAGRMVVCYVGKETEIGKIAVSTSIREDEATPLQKRLADLSLWQAWLMVALSCLAFFLGLWQNHGLWSMLLTAVALAVASIPEGLNIAITVVLAIGMNRLLKQNVLARKMIAVETLGSVTVICTDKTGTLTTGEMKLASLMFNRKSYDNMLEAAKDEAGFKRIFLASQLCNEAIVESDRGELADWKFIGLPTDVALIKWAVASGVRREDFLGEYRLIEQMPFDNEAKSMASLHQHGGEFIIYKKGAPEKIFPVLSHYFEKNEMKPITEDFIGEIEGYYHEYTKRGLRVLAVAQKIAPIDHLDDWRNELGRLFVFVGLIALIDPIRPDAKEAIEECESLGLKPVVITGDHKLTAKEIAITAGIPITEQEIMTGEELDAKSDEEFGQIVGSIKIFARVSPHHKTRIVNLLKSRGEVVAMVGDGINDAPSLKAADVGIALGSGTDLAKEAADLVLLDSNFRHIVSAINEGRLIFRNIKKIVNFFLSDSLSQVILVIGSILFGLPLALLPGTILWLNIVQDGLPGYALAMETGDISIKRKNQGQILDKESKIRVFGVGLIRDLLILGIFYIFFKSDFDLTQIRTLAFALMGTTTLVNVFSMRSLDRNIWQIDFWSNRYLIYSVVFGFALLLVGIYSPINSYLGTAAMDRYFWVLVFIIAALNLALIEAVKLIFKKKAV